MANEFQKMQKLAGLITESEYRESQTDEAEINPVTKKKFDNLLARAEKAVAEKDKETLQKIYDKALTTGSKGWKYFIQALYDKGLAHQDGAYLKWNLDESSKELNEIISDEAIERMEGLVNTNHLSNLKSSLHSLIPEWIQDGGFDEDDVIDYLTHLVKSSY